MGGAAEFGRVESLGGEARAVGGGAVGRIGIGWVGRIGIGWVGRIGIAWVGRIGIAWVGEVDGEVGDGGVDLVGGGGFEG